VRKVGPEPVVRKEVKEFDRLAAMRHVLGNPPETDQSEGERACREWLKKSPGQFMSTLDELEKKAANPETPVNEELEKTVEETQTDEELKQAINELIARHTQGSPT